MDSFYFGFKKMHAKCLRKVPKEFQIGSGPTSMYCEGSILFEGIMLMPTSSSHSTASVMQQPQLCISYAAATALHQAPIRDFITATTQTNIYIYIYILPASQQHNSILFFHQKRYYSSNLHKLFAKKGQSSIKDKKNFDHYKL